MTADLCEKRLHFMYWRKICRIFLQFHRSTFQNVLVFFLANLLSFPTVYFPLYFNHLTSWQKTKRASFSMHTCNFSIFCTYVVVLFFGGRACFGGGGGGKKAEKLLIILMLLNRKVDCSARARWSRCDVPGWLRAEMNSRERRKIIALLLPLYIVHLALFISNFVAVWLYSTKYIVQQSENELYTYPTFLSI